MSSSIPSSLDPSSLDPSSLDPSTLVPAGFIPARGDASGNDTIETLPFTIRRVQNDDDLRKAVGIRHAAYARHLPEFARTLVLPEESDYDRDAVILLAESKLDGTALGSTRIQTNLRQALHVEESIELPLWLQTRRLAEVTRLGIGEGRIGRVVKLALIKACFQHCEQNRIDYAIVTGRAPIDRQYEQLLFEDVFASKAHIPLRHVGMLPHRVMSFEIATGQQRWEAARHPMLNFFRHTRHPDIDISLQRSERRPSRPAWRVLAAPAPLQAHGSMSHGNMTHGNMTHGAVAA